jgi:putative SOS response-associated peptidase YedK
MCGRFVIDDSGSIGEIKKIFEELKKHYGNTIEFSNAKTGEIYPGDTIPVIIPEKECNIDAVPMKWGITRNYDNKNTLIINARSEGVYDKKMFRDSIRNKRCIIPSNGFYEWAQLHGRDKKEKFLIKPAHTPMLYFAGIYEKLPDPLKPDTEQVRFVIMTREALGHVRSIHSRMPVVVNRKDLLKWLNGEPRHINEIFNEPIPEYSFTNLGGVG